MKSQPGKKKKETGAMMVTFTAWVSRGDHKEKKKSYFGFKQSIHHIVGIEEKKKKFR